LSRLGGGIGTRGPGETKLETDRRRIRHRIAGLKREIAGVRRREGPRRGGFPGAEIILGQIAAATPRRRVGLLPEIKAPLRHGEIVYDDGERQVGRITSGGFGPSVGAAIAMAYVEAGSSAPGTRLHALVRGQKRICKVAALPFVSHRYFRGPAT